MATKKFLIVIGGATATGKTAMGIHLAQHFDTHILSCDSRQFYHEMNIGVARPTPEELATAPHHFVAHLSMEKEYSVGDFEQDALNLLDELFAKKNVVLLVGGSGLFIKALCEGLDEFPEVPDEVRQDVEKLFAQEGIVALQNELKSTDPIYFEEVDIQNPVRLIRALSVIRASGQPFSFFRKNKKKERPFIPIYVQLKMERSTLYERINRRVDQMMATGLEEEALSIFSALKNKPRPRALGIGYLELFDFFEKKISLERAVELIQQNSRRYAKRQMTWLRRDAHWNIFHPKEFKNVQVFVTQKMNELSPKNN